MTFNELVAADYKNPTVALFYGLHCAPCERLKPKLKEACAKMNVRLEEFNSANEMAAVRALGLRTVPAVVVTFKGVQTIAMTGDASVELIMASLALAGVRTA